jgi:REP element-mobilizing transposase RayT
MSNDFDLPRRKPLRWREHDYCQEAGYFVTICTFNRECLFGKVDEQVVNLNELGKLVEQEWLKTATLRDYVILDEHVVMPNHVHGIIFIERGPPSLQQPEPESAAGKVTQPCSPSTGGTRRRSLGLIVGGFKAAATARINLRRGTPRAKVWQRGYFDRVIRTPEELDSIREYIGENPPNWPTDQYHPNNPVT